MAGQHWQPLTLAKPAVLEDSGEEFIPPTTHILWAQGTRLYAAGGCGAFCSGPGLDILTSTDGGATWKLVDHDISAALAHICDFTAAPSGTDVYALASEQTCSDMTLVPLSVWHSADAGAHWTKQGPAPSDADMRMLGVATSAGPALLYGHFPKGVAQGHGITITNTPDSLKVSADNGKTWQSAPTTGVPAGASSAGPLCALPDGTVVEAFGSQALDLGLYGWKLGDTAWHQIAPKAAGQVRLLLAEPGSDGAGYTLIAATFSGDSTSGAKITVQTYAPSQP